LSDSQYVPKREFYNYHHSTEGDDLLEIEYASSDELKAVVARVGLQQNGDVAGDEDVLLMHFVSDASSRGSIWSNGR
jgi:hypothetical protein